MLTEQLEKLEIYHQQFNLDKKHNLDEIPACKAVFGIFAIVNEEPLNCRHIDVADDLRQAAQQLYEQPVGEGMKKFMQGPWIQMLVYRRLTDEQAGNPGRILEDWKEKYRPDIDEEGEYPGYYEY
jgi:hypothetical protein